MCQITEVPREYPTPHLTPTVSRLTLVQQNVFPAEVDHEFRPQTWAINLTLVLLVAVALYNRLQRRSILLRLLEYQHIDVMTDVNPVTNQPTAPPIIDDVGL